MVGWPPVSYDDRPASYLDPGLPAGRLTFPRWKRLPFCGARRITNGSPLYRDLCLIDRMRPRRDSGATVSEAWQRGTCLGSSCMADILVPVGTATTLLMPSMVFNPKTWRAASCEWGYRGDAAEAVSRLPVGKCRRWRPGGLDRLQPRHPRHPGVSRVRRLAVRRLPRPRASRDEAAHQGWMPLLPPIRGDASPGGGPPGIWRNAPWVRLLTTTSWSASTA